MRSARTVPELLVMCYVLIALLMMCWTAATAHNMSYATHMSYYVPSMWYIKISMFCVVVGYVVVEENNNNKFANFEYVSSSPSTHMYEQYILYIF